MRGVRAATVMVLTKAWSALHPDEPSAMPFVYVCECCGEEISQHKGVAVHHENACLRRALA